VDDEVETVEVVEAVDDDRGGGAWWWAWRGY
jgi:hypothetical protein